MTSDLHRALLRLRALPARLQALVLLALVVLGGAIFRSAKPYSTKERMADDTALSSQSMSQSRRVRGLFFPSAAQWATLTVEPVQQRVFRSEHVTEGKIAVDEDRSTPIFSPYAGRVTKLFVKPGDTVTAGQPLFTVEATDMVQAGEGDMVTAVPREAVIYEDQPHGSGWCATTTRRSSCGGSRSV